jgi:hypothetical protein
MEYPELKPLKDAIVRFEELGEQLALKGIELLVNTGSGMTEGGYRRIARTFDAAFHLEMDIQQAEVIVSLTDTEENGYILSVEFCCKPNTMGRPSYVLTLSDQPYSADEPKSPIEGAIELADELLPDATRADCTEEKAMDAVAQMSDLFTRHRSKQHSA